MKKKFFLLLLIFLLAAPNFTFHAVIGSTAGWQNVNRTIEGFHIHYTFDVPVNWRARVTVNRVVYVQHPQLVERLVFHYNPSSVSLSSTVLFEVLIFMRKQWNENLNYITLVEMDDYVFAIRPAAANPFVFGSDRLMFNSMLREASNPAFLINYISVPIGSDTVVRNVVSVNGVRMNSPSHTNALRVVFVPLREVAESLGYSVGWDAASGNVRIDSGTFHTTLVTGVGQRHNLLNLDGVSYVSTMFFLQVMGCNVEIDEFSNVRITR